MLANYSKEKKKGLSADLEIHFDPDKLRFGIQQCSLSGGNR